MPKKAIIAVQTTSDVPRIRSRDPKTTWAQYQAILEWLEIPANFNLVEGRATSTMKTGTVAGAKVTKRAGFAELADWVNEKCGCNWDRKKAEDRYRVYKKMFKDTKRNQLDPTGAKYNIGPKDHAKGVHTIEHKLDKDCPNFKRMDVLYGGRQNITPAVVLVGSKRSAAHMEAANAAGGDESSSDDDEESAVEDSISISSRDDDGDNNAEIVGGDNEDNHSEDADDDYQAECAVALASLAASTSTTARAAAAAAAAATPAATTTAAATTVAAAVAAGPSPVTDVSNLTEPSMETNKPLKERKSKQSKKSADKTSLLPTALKDKCAETVGSASNAAELTAKIAEMKNNGTGKGRKDFTSTYAEAKTKEIELARDKFEFEKENYAVKREDDNSHSKALLEQADAHKKADLQQADAHFQGQIQQGTRNAIITEMIRKGSSTQEIKDALALLL